MKNQTYKSSLLILAILMSSFVLKAQSITEGFNDITTLVPNGWHMQNNSSPVGSTGWFQGNTTVFTAQSGPTDSYIGANFNNAGGSGDISNWLLTPSRTIRNGDTVSFYTRSNDDTDFPDRLEFRMSTSGTGTNVGTSATDVGDFTTELVTINPNLTPTGYPVTWQLYSFTISGLSAPVEGRFAFRYQVTNAGPSGTFADYIGIDNFVYTPYQCPMLSISPDTLHDGTAGEAYSADFIQTGALENYTFTISSGMLPPGLALSLNGELTGTPDSAGIFTFEVTVTDASDCSTTASFSLEILCPELNVSLDNLPDLCDNGLPHTLTEGLPIGGIYSGSGVTNNIFDPGTGTQSITYIYTDQYACVDSATNTITVNPAPSVSLTLTSTDFCENENSVSLEGGSPAGGTFSGDFVSNDMFDPQTAGLGSFDITYFYSDANGCSNAATESVTVNTAPNVTLEAFDELCENGSVITLSGGNPQGGTYAVDGTTATTFDPTTSGSGTYTVSYVYTDANGCTDVAETEIIVTICSSVEEQPFFNASRIYPNPANDFINIHFSDAAQKQFSIEIFDVRGKKLFSGKYASNKNIQIEVSDFISGIYFIRLNSSEYSAVEKLIIR